MKLVRESLRTPKADWLLEHQTLADVARALLLDQDTCPVVRVANQTTQPFTLAAGTEVGQASLATVLDEGNDNRICKEGLGEPHSIIYDFHMATTVKQIADFTHLQPVIDSLPADLTPSERGRLYNLSSNIVTSFLVENLTWVEHH